jgi:hypothetical protein
VSRKLELGDTLGEIASFTYAIRMAAKALPEPRSRNALCLMIDTIDERLNAARSIIDHLRDADDAESAR